MRKYAKALFHGAMLVMSMLVLAGCGRREAASEIVVFQLDTQTTQKPETTPAQYESASRVEPNATTNITVIPTATPEAAGKTESKPSTSDADIDQLMEDLEDTLNELDASITAADRDTLTDAALIALGK